MACFFLACKVEETPKKLKDIIMRCHECHKNPTKKDPSYRPLTLDSPEFPKLRQRVLQSERLILQTLFFDLTIEHPQKALVPALTTLGLAQDKNLGQVAYNFINDRFVRPTLASLTCSQQTFLAIQVPPVAVRIASIYLAAKMTNTLIPDQKKPEWWEDFGVRAEHIIST